MIQDAAAKCRYCGEWLDPTKRPDWSESSSPAIASDPAATTTDGSVHRPRRRATQTWSAPAWMAREDAPAPTEAESAPTPAPEPTPEPEPEVSAEQKATQVLPTVAAPAQPSEPSAEDLAERMQRIKASAAAVREAMLRESVPDAPNPDDEIDEAADTMHAEARPQRPSKTTALDASAMFGADLDDDDDDDDLSEPPRSKAAKRDRDDDALPPAAGLDAFSFDDDFDDDDDDDDFDGDFGDVGASRPLPWKPVALGVGLAAAIGVMMFWGRLFPSETLEETPAGEEANNAEDSAAPGPDGQVAQGSVAPTPGQGQPVVPEGQPGAAVAAPAPQAPPAGEGAPSEAAADSGAAPVAPAAAEDPSTPGADQQPAAVPAEGTPAAATPPAPSPLAADAVAMLDEARTLYQKGGSKRLREAKEKLEGILGNAPNSADALLLMAQVQLELGETEASLATATKCTNVAPQTADCWLSIGVLKQNEKDKPAAAAAYERYLALAPEGAYASQVKKQLARLE